MNEPELAQHAAVAAATPEARALAEHGSRPVSRLARLLAAVPSLGPTARAWTRLGFRASEPFDYLGCRAFDVGLNGPGIRFLAVGREGPTTSMSALVGDRLAAGAGLLGWSWACHNVRKTREIIEENTGLLLPETNDSLSAVIVPTKLTPGAATVLEPLVYVEPVEHGNHVDHIDHLVVTVSQVDRAADIYERAFGLSAKRRSSNSTRYAFLKVGRATGAVIELVGPRTPSSESLVGHTWGVTFRTPDIDRTVASLRRARIEIADPHDAVQGGRITSVPMQLGGIQIAFISD